MQCTTNSVTYFEPKYYCSSPQDSWSRTFPHVHCLPLMLVLCTPTKGIVYTVHSLCDFVVLFLFIFFTFMCRHLSYKQLLPKVHRLLACDRSTYYYDILLAPNFFVLEFRFVTKYAKRRDIVHFPASAKCMHLG